MQSAVHAVAFSAERPTFQSTLHTQAHSVAMPDDCRHADIQSFHAQTQCVISIAFFSSTVVFKKAADDSRHWNVGFLFVTQHNIEHTSLLLPVL